MQKESQAVGMNESAKLKLKYRSWRSEIETNKFLFKRNEGMQ